MSEMERQGGLVGRLAWHVQGSRPALLAGVALAFSGGATYWDIASHFDGGRERFLTPPHIGIYSGVTVALLIIGLTMLADRLLAGASLGQAILHPFRGVRPGLAAAATGMATALVAAPLDNAWHEIYGIDITIWSPPHLLAIFGVSAAILGLAMLVAPVTDHHRPLLYHFLFAAFLAGLVVTTAEFEFNGPQYRIAYHPTVLAAAVALVLVSTTQGLDRWGATRTAFTFEGLRLASVLYLVSRGHSLPFVPVILPTAFVADVSRDAIRRHPLVLGAGLGAITVITNAVLLEWFGGITWRGDDLWLGLLGAVVASSVATVVGVRLGEVMGGRRRSAETRRRSMVFGLVVASVLAASVPSAYAHDVGGDAGAGVISWTPATFGPQERVEIEMRDLQLTSGASPETVTVEVWRAEHRIDVPLVKQGDAYVGSFELPDEGPWMLLIRVRSGDESLLATRQIEADATSVDQGGTLSERFTLGLDALAASDPPAWLNLLAYGISLGIFVLLLLGLIRSVRRLSTREGAWA